MGVVGRSRWWATAVTLFVALGMVLTGSGDADAKRRKRKKRVKKPKKLKKLKAPWLDQHETAVWDQIRRLRQSPRYYAGTAMKAFKAKYDGMNIKVGDTLLQTNEGTAPVDEAIGAMTRLKRSKKIKLSKQMSQAAKDHALWMGKSGSADHIDDNGYGPGARLDRYGSWKNRNAQILSLQFKDPADIIPWLLTNDGIPARGYRKALLNKKFRVGGVGCSPHKTYAHTCVILLTEKFKPHKGGPRPIGGDKSQLKVYVKEKK